MPQRTRRTQAERRAQSRQAILDAASAHLARGGYASLNLDEVTKEAGYTRGAFYHQFANKQALAEAAIDREFRYWQKVVGVPAIEDSDPAHALVQMARNHAIFCRRPVARLLTTLRAEFHGRDDPIGATIESFTIGGIAFIAELIRRAQEAGTISATTEPQVLATAYFGALEGIAIALSDTPPDDEELAARVVAGLLNPDRLPNAGEAPER